MRRLFLPIALLLVIICGCTEKKYYTGSNDALRFSVDTVYFDTVFTSFGTSTRELRVVNNSSNWIKIDEISLAEGNSPYRLNIDGLQGNSREDIDLAPGDSIFIFVDAVIDPNNSANPIAFNDSICFFYNNYLQDINILAWGQDIILIEGEEISTQTWTEGRPYVVYNSMMVDTGEVLTIEEGSKIFFHRGSTMYVAGTLIAEGSYEKRIEFASDRVEDLYKDIPGQWDGIYFLNGSSGNIIKNTEIRNAVSAVHLGNLGTGDLPPDISLYNVVIQHNSATGLSSLGGVVKAENCVINHCGFYSLYLALGGTYDFVHCTVNSFWDYNTRTTAGILISDYAEYNGVLYPGILQSAIFSNSSLTGSLKNEIEIFSFDGSALDCQFMDCVLTIDESLEFWSDYNLTQSLVSSDPGYISIGDYDLRPDTLSVLVNNADPLISATIQADLRGFSRFNDMGPDIGAYERQIGEISSK